MRSIPLCSSYILVVNTHFGHIPENIGTVLIEDE